MRAIEQCRTEALGGQVYACQQCGEVQYSYHSCRNRHCPKCQNDKAQEWLGAQQGLLLPEPYFMLTFTLPAALCEVVRSNQSLLNNLLFRISAAAAQHLAKDPRFVGGQIGLVGILHTWGRNLAYHPHIHYLLPAGGLAADTQTWLPARQDFLLPVKALSKIFRGKFRQALQKTALFMQVPARVWQQEWVVHCKPVGNGRAALKYLAPYVFRVAISNRRLVSLENGWLHFATGRRTQVSPGCAHSLPKHSSTVSYSMCCPRGSSRCVTLASLHPAAANACLRCAYRSNRNARRTWKSHKPHQSQPVQPQSQSCAALAAASPCFFSASFNPRGAAHHELSGFPAPAFLLDAGSHACIRVSTRLMPENIHPNSGSPACAGRLFGCTINTKPPI